MNPGACPKAFDRPDGEAHARWVVLAHGRRILWNDPGDQADPSDESSRYGVDKNSILLVVGSGGRRYREYLLASAAQRRALWLLDGAEPSWQAPYVKGASVVELLDPARLVPDQELMVKTAVALAADQPVAGVVCYDETLVVTTAHIAETLGLPGLTVAGVENCRNKHRNRRVLTEAGLPQPRFAYVTDSAAARAAADEFGYPVVLKPRGMGASIGVVRALGPAGIDAAFTLAERASYGGAPAYEGGVLVEEFLTGPEISIDGVSFQGEYRPFCLARKRTGLDPYFEEIGHLVTADDPLLADPELVHVLTEAHRAIGVRDGSTHTEVKLTGRGPAIIEVNARLGGDLIPYLGKLATGIDPAFVAVDAATGVRPDLTRTARGSVGIRFCYPPVDGRIRTVEVPAPGEVSGLVEAAAMVAPGTVLRLPPRGYLSRCAFVICRADSPAACEAALDTAAARVSIGLEPIEEC